MLTVGPFLPDERESYAALWRAYMASGEWFYPDPLEEVIDANWAEMTAARPRLHGFALRTDEGKGPAGFACYVIHPCTKALRDEAYLSDLFVDPGCRNRGGGRMLLEAVIADCRRQGLFRLTWITEPENLTAQRIYRQYAPESDWKRYKLVL